MTRGAYGGITPRHAVCEACGHHLGGAPIRDDHIRCPECAHDNPVCLPPPGAHAATLAALRRRRAVFRTIAVVLVAGLMILIALLRL